MSVISIDVMNAMRYIGVSPEDYELSSASFIRRQISRIHGIGHIYRVMIFVALLAERKQKSREGLLAFCAAYLHDLARLNDGWDPEHGFRAVSLMSQYNALWEKYNLSSVELEYIKYAMANHNKGCRYSGDLSKEMVVSLLKDADALDRVRFNNYKARLKIAWLQYEESKTLINLAQQVYMQTYRIDRIGMPINLQQFISLLQLE